MSDDDFDGYSFAVTVAVGAGTWNVRSYNDPFNNPQDSLNAVRTLRSEGAAFALLCVDDDYFVVVRPVPGGARWFISDATMAVVDGYGDGDFDIFEDLGVNEYQLAAYVDNDEDYPSDMLLRIAGELGFGDELEEEINS